MTKAQIVFFRDQAGLMLKEEKATSFPSPKIMKVLAFGSNRSVENLSCPQEDEHIPDRAVDVSEECGRCEKNTWNG